MRIELLGGPLDGKHLDLPDTPERVSLPLPPRGRAITADELTYPMTDCPVFIAEYVRGRSGTRYRYAGSRRA